MIVFRVLGILLAIALGLIILMTIFALFAPMRVECKRKLPDGPFRLRIGVGPVKRVFTLGKRKKKQPPRQPKPKKEPKPKQPKPPQAPWFDIKKLDYGQAFSLLLTLIDDMAGTMTWEKLYVAVILHMSDAAKTGEMLGALSAAVGNLYPYLERAFVLQDTKIVLDADFDAEKTIWSADIAVMTRLSRFVHVFWKRRKALWALWKSIRTTKEERETWSREHLASEDKMERKRE